MPRRKRGQPVHGWVVLDKPFDMTSTQAVGKVRWLYNAQKAGHAGTLDPLATGILPIALGDATKTVPFIVDADKEYTFTVQFGAETTTDDSEGDITRTADATSSAVSSDVIEARLPEFVGQISQVPPQFSAIKVNGERAYDIARDGEDVDLKARPVDVHAFSLTRFDPDAQQATFHVACGKGTYVRALARDLGRALGVFGHVVGLRRTRVGPFREAASVALARLVAAREATEAAVTDAATQDVCDKTAGDALAEALQPVSAALVGLSSFKLSETDCARLRRGQSVLLRGRDVPVEESPVCAFGRGNVLVALGEVRAGQLHPRKVFAA